MGRDTFNTVAWDNIEAFLKGTSKIYKTWYAKQGLGFFKVGY